MAKGKTGYLGMFAFVAIVLNAIAWGLTAIFSACGISGGIPGTGMTIQGILTTIASVLLLIVALFSAYDYAQRQSKVWRIVFWVLAIVSLIAIFFGFGFPNFLR